MVCAPFDDAANLLKGWCIAISVIGDVIETNHEMVWVTPTRDFKFFGSCRDHRVKLVTKFCRLFDVANYG